MGKEMLRILRMGVKDGATAFTIVMFAELSKNALSNYSPALFFKPESPKNKEQIIGPEEEKTASNSSLHP